MTAARPLGNTPGVSPSRKELLIWLGGALLIVLAVLLWLVLTAPEENLLPEQYQYGVL